MMRHGTMTASLLRCRRVCLSVHHLSCLVHHRCCCCPRRRHRLLTLARRRRQVQSARQSRVRKVSDNAH